MSDETATLAHTVVELEAEAIEIRVTSDELDGRALTLLDDDAAARPSC